jgi:protocatechuate 3,4-dioxygenase beta subunit
MPARPLRPGEAPPKGSGILRGYVRAAGTGAPVRRAQVRAMSQEGRGGGVTSTDSEGRFEIKDLAAGRYMLMVNKAGYVQASYGQQRPNEPGTPIDLGEGQIAEKIAFSLQRGGVISGVVFDDGGEPVAGTQVQAMRYQFMGGQRRLVPASSDSSDDRGAFRIYGLPPGEYFISAVNRMGQMMVAPNMTSTEQDGFAPTYYPGTPNLGEAGRVTIKAGQEMTGANFAMVVARMARVSGRVLNSRGEPIGGQRMLMLSPADPLISVGGMNMNNAMLAGDGAFTFTNVAPGRYNLNVRPMGQPGPTEEFAVMPITVGNDDIENLIVTTSLGATIRGVVLTDDGTPPTFRPDQVQIFASPVDMGINMIGGGPTKVNDDFSFEMNTLFDRRMIRAATGGGMGAQSGWYLKAVLFDGEDVTDRGIDFVAGRAYEGLQIIFTRKATDLSGLVTDDRGKPVLDVSVIVFPANRDLWTPQSRYVRTLRPDTSGRYTIKNLPPLDDYMVIAVQNLESGQGGDPEFLNRAREEAKSFSLNEGETKAVDIKVARLVP